MAELHPAQADTAMHRAATSGRHAQSCGHPRGARKNGFTRPRVPPTRRMRYSAAMLLEGRLPSRIAQYGPVFVCLLLLSCLPACGTLVADKQAPDAAIGCPGPDAATGRGAYAVVHGWPQLAEGYVLGQ